MNRKISEQIFSHAVALNQSGTLKSTIYVKDRIIYILNADKTVLLKFRIPAQEPSYTSEVSFNANDYDSNKFTVKDGDVVFSQSGEEWDRKKSCSSPDLSFTDVDVLWKEYDGILEPKIINSTLNYFWISSSVISLLEEDLSHIELSVENKQPKLIQKNIYTGTTVSLSQKTKKGLSIEKEDKIINDLEPIGLRTKDFMALFSFNDKIKLWYDENKKFIHVKGKIFNMHGIISCCVYDELGTIERSNDGGEKSENRRRKQKTNPETSEEIPKRKRIRRRTRS